MLRIIFGMILGWSLTFFSPSCEAKEYKYELTVCCIFRNETKWLPEWIDFHLKQGVQHFYLYDHMSDDHPEVALKTYIDENIVEIIPWNYPIDEMKNWPKIQCAAYNNCIHRIRKQAKWCAFIDTDEFLFCPDKTPLPIKLLDYDDYAGIAVNWVMYGTSHVQKIPEGQKMHNVLTMRAPFSQPINLNTKAIVKPKYVSKCPCCHYFEYKNSKNQKRKHFAVTENKQLTWGLRTTSHSVNIFRINHYWSRDIDFFMNVKLKNRNWNINVDMIKEESEYNAVYDPILVEVSEEDSVDLVIP